MPTTHSAHNPHKSLKDRLREFVLENLAYQENFNTHG